jgi:hypothetical protein
MVFAINETTALSFAIAFNVMEIIVMDLIGVIALWREAGSWASMKAQIRSVTVTTTDSPLV